MTVTADARSAVQTRAGNRIRVGESVHNDATDFLYEEAHFLEMGKFEDWLLMLDEDIEYVAPVRRTRLRHEGSEFDPAMKHFEETIDTLKQRVRRLQTRYAFAEDPPSRTRRLVTNIRVHETDVPNEYAVASSLLVLRNRTDDPTFHLLAALREDVLRQHPEGMKLLRRTILLDSAALPTHNLAIFL
ncbi:3-phenylpropionate/cinnamic acid dioxygenase subunit beta [Mycobacterium sp.]|uniref:3-phenylpropionate/cinnamic acid dioxygenase subunit beta n=1 Tax=Mycobacterium sp. TaxID=1785 RepID=UPI003BAF7370